MKLMQGKFYLQSMQQDVRLYSRKGSLMQGVIMERISLPSSPIPWLPSI